MKVWFINCLEFKALRASLPMAAWADSIMTHTCHIRHDSRVPRRCVLVEGEARPRSFEEVFHDYGLIDEEAIRLLRKIG